MWRGLIGSCESNPYPVDSGVFKGNTYKKKIKKKQTEKTAAQIRFQSQRPHITITSMKDNINMDSAIAVSMNARR
jgi:ABC-type transport system involved in cytochrome bd biosynthesis fused ATPase/permease subunit